MQLKPCPFCGGTNLEEVDSGCGDHWMVCKDCDARGPNGFAPKVVWETRYNDPIITGSVSEVCHKHHLQCCHICEDIECCDNVTEGAKKYRALKAAVRKYIKAKDACVSMSQSKRIDAQLLDRLRKMVGV